MAQPDACPACGTATEPGQEYCLHCGSRIVPPRHLSGFGEAWERRVGRYPGDWVFASVLLHEFGHCFGARAVDGDATEVLLWPLGGLANTEVPHTPRANFITTAAGPAVNVVLCLAVCVLLAFGSLTPSFKPWSDPSQ